jgi:hypothetical protein
MHVKQFIHGIRQAHAAIVQSHPPRRTECTLGSLDIIEATGFATLADGSRLEIRTTGKGSTTEARFWSAAMEVLERTVVLEARADARGALRTVTLACCLWKIMAERQGNESISRK